MVTTAIYDETENEFNFSGWSNYGWRKIDNGDIESIALLLGHVGVLCGMTYGDEASSASTYNDLPDALSFYGIGCSRMESWDTSIIINNFTFILFIAINFNIHITKSSHLFHYSKNKIKNQQKRR